MEDECQHEWYAHPHTAFLDGFRCSKCGRYDPLEGLPRGLSGIYIDDPMVREIIKRELEAQADIQRRFDKIIEANLLDRGGWDETHT